MNQYGNNFDMANQQQQWNQQQQQWNQQQQYQQQQQQQQQQQWNQQMLPQGQPQAPQQTSSNDVLVDNQGGDEEDNSRRPANAFILYSQEMRSRVRQENPSYSNTEVSRLLGKMWKEVPNESKLKYKQKAAQAQEEFKRTHPDYIYRKARRKRALNELLTKSTQGIQQFDPTAQMQMFANNTQMMMYAGMMGQNPGANAMQGMTPGMGYPGMDQMQSMGQQNQQMYQ